MLTLTWPNKKKFSISRGRFKVKLAITPKPLSYQNLVLLTLTRKKTNIMWLFFKMEAIQRSWTLV
jgi:hypothetical protein